VNGEVAKVLEVFNENAQGIDKLNETVNNFMKKLLRYLEEG
jgi:hypothetical protein